VFQDEFININVCFNLCEILGVDDQNQNCLMTKPNGLTFRIQGSRTLQAKIEILFVKVIMHSISFFSETPKFFSWIF
jgi:hypothetical protein